MWSSGGESDAPSWPGASTQAGGPWPGGGGANPNQPAWPSPADPRPAGWGSPSPAPTPTPAAQHSPTVPYRQTLPNGVRDGLLINIKGRIKPKANRITVDLRTQGDIAFHFNPRFNEGGQQVIVRNSCQSKKWGKEERELGRFPFAQGKPFEMEISCTSSEFKVSVDRSPVLTFKHRVTDLRSINTLCICNDLDLDLVRVD